MADLPRVLPVAIAQDVDNGRGTEITTSIELWPDNVVIHTTIIGIEPAAPDDIQRYRECELTDDLGTTYMLWSGGSGHGSNDRWTTDVTFAPAAPADATELRFRSGWSRQTLTVPLR